MNNNVQKYIILLLMGIGMMILGCKSVIDMAAYTNKWKSFEPTAVGTDATITQIWSYQHRGGARVNVHIEYEDMNGEKHSGNLDVRPKDTEEGDEIRVYYDKNDPDSVMLKPETALEHAKSATVIIFFFGVMMLIGSAVMKKLST